MNSLQDELKVEAEHQLQQIGKAIQAAQAFEADLIVHYKYHRNSLNFHDSHICDAYIVYIISIDQLS